MTTKLQPTTTFRAVLGQVFEVRRSALKLSQKDFSDAIGASQSAWSRVENGQSSLTVEEFVLVCNALRLRTADALQRVDQSINYLRKRGVNVVTRPGKEGKPNDESAAWLSAAALGALLVAIISTAKK